MAKPATPSKTYKITLGGEVRNVKFGNMAIIAIEDMRGDLQTFLEEFAVVADAGKDGAPMGKVFAVLSTLVVAGLAHSGATLKTIDDWDFEEMQEAFEPLVEAFAERFAHLGGDDAPAGEAEAAPAA